MEDAPSVDDLDRNNVESVQAFLHFWDQHVSTWHPDKDCPPAAIHPSAQLFNTLQDTKKELAEMLNRLQRPTKCAPGYCERRKKTLEQLFVDLFILNHAENFQNFQKTQVENLWSSIHVEMMSFSTPTMLHLFWVGEQTLTSDQ